MSEQLSFDAMPPPPEEVARRRDGARRAAAAAAVARAERLVVSTEKLRRAFETIVEPGGGRPKWLSDLEAVGARAETRIWWKRRPLDEVCDDVAAACLHQPVAGRHRADRFLVPQIPAVPNPPLRHKHAAESRFGDVAVRSVLIVDYVPHAPPAPPMVRPLRCDSVCERRYDGGPMCDQCGAYPGDLPLPEGATS